MSDVINVIGISGGKDSTATALYAIENIEEPLRFVFCDTGLESPITYEYIDYLDGKLKELTGVGIEVIKADLSEAMARKRERLVASGDTERAKHITPTGTPFLDVCLLNGRFPSSLVRFCTGTLKQSVIEKKLFELSEYGNVFSWVGERADESLARSKKNVREMIFKNSNGNEVYIYRPILRWKQEQCFEMLKKHGIKPNPLYEKGFSRVGCFPCVMARKDELRLIAETCPEVIDKIKSWEEQVSKVAPPNAFSTFFHPVKCGGSFGIEAAVEWSKTSRGGKQYQLELDK